MSCQTDLQKLIRNAYKLIRDYELIIRTSDRPKERMRAGRIIREQWMSIEAQQGDYLALAGTNVPRDIERILVHAETWESDLDNLLQVPPLQGTYRNRLIMLGKVRRFWVESVLEQSLYQVARIELEIKEQPGAVTYPWEMVVQGPNHAPRTLEPGVQMSDVFDDLDGSLLILGAPGTGKTTMLLELADDLLDRAERDPAHPIPVVFNLSTWAMGCKPFAAWLVDELNRRYDVPRVTGRNWVDDEAILPLLDGLDEVAEDGRDACAEAINAYREKHSLVPMAVCSRVEEYATLVDRLCLGGAVIIQPLARDRIDAYLARAGEALTRVRSALEADETLYALFQTPLMLSVAALAYRGVEPDAGVLASSTVEKRHERLFAAYVEAMYERREVESGYTRAQSERWLSWLASGMVEREQTVFCLDHIQPNWLPAGAHRALYRLFVGLVFGLIFGLIFGLVFGLVFGSLLGLVVFGLFGGLAGGLFNGLVFGLFGGAFDRQFDGQFDRLDVGSNDIQPVEVLRWSWSKARSGLFFKLFSGLVGGLFLGLFGGLFFGLFFGLDGGLFFGVFFGLLGALFFGLFNALGGGLVGGELTTRERPDEGIRRSAANGLFVGLVFGLVGVLLFGLVGALFAGLFGVLYFGLFFGLFFGLVGGLFVKLDDGSGGGAFFGLGRELGNGAGEAVVQHLVLRALLWRNGYAPWHYVSFLDHAVERVLLRHVGGGYIFVHRSLMEHLAGQAETTGQVKAARRSLHWWRAGIVTVLVILIAAAVLIGYREMAASFSASRGQRSFRAGDVEEAMEAYARATELDPESIWNWRNFCREGSLAGQAAAVVDACERAVALDPEDGIAHNYRGLARVLTGDYKGAIEDFQFYIKWSRSWQGYSLLRNVRTRKEWIAKLETGRNPFDEETLKQWQHGRFDR